MIGNNEFSTSPLSFAIFAKKNVLAAAIMLFNDEILDEDEMFCVFSKLNRKNPPFPYWNYDRIEKQMDDMSSAEIKSEFRFGHSELPLLAEALQIPQYFVCSNGTVASGMEGLLMLLKRFAYPCRLSDMIPRFLTLSSRNQFDFGWGYRLHLPYQWPSTARLEPALVRATATREVCLCYSPERGCTE